MKENILFKKYCQECIIDAIKICKEFNDTFPIAKKQYSEFVLKNGFQKEKTVQKNDYDTFFTNNSLRNNLEDNDIFKMFLNFLAARSYVKKYFNNQDPIEIKSKIFLLIENYVSSYDENSLGNNFQFDSSLYKKISKEFEQYIFKDILFINYFTPLYNFKSNSDEILFTDLSIKQINPKQFKIIKEDLVGRSATPSKMYKLTHVLETNIPFCNDFIQEENNAKERFENLIESARIFQSGDIQIGGIYRDYTKWSKYSYQRAGTDESRASKNIFEIKGKKITEFKKFYNEFLKIGLKSNSWAFLERAINRFNLSTSRNSVIEKFIDLNISLEAMFSGGSGETTLKLANRIAAFLPTTDDDREYYWIFMKEEYKRRNEIVHGKEMNPVVIDEKTQLNPEQVLEFLQSIVRNSIKKYLNLTYHYKEKNAKDKILDDIDLGLINRIKLEKFLEKTKGPF